MTTNLLIILLIFCANKLHSLFKCTNECSELHSLFKCTNECSELHSLFKCTN